MTVEKEKHSKEKILPIRLSKELYKRMRILSFESEISMAELCRQGVEIILEKHEKTKGNKKTK
ncbi:MAG: hypothetical protein JSS53_09835 [Proteobacteria bacterium]|nr:hypothetical protein [Pseudomonadota bacterium]